MGTMGILFAFLALFFWGVGDFLIQKSARKFGDWVALFYIATMGVLMVTLFVYKDVGAVLNSPRDLAILLTASGVILAAALFELEALRVGKISVVEPVFASELLVTSLLAGFILREQLNLGQVALLALLIIGIILVATRSWKDWRRIHLERGVGLAVSATLGMGMVNFLFGIGAREISPLMINWFTDLFLMMVAFFYLLSRGRIGEIWDDWRVNRGLILGVGLADNAAWLAYSFSMLYLPIAIATGITESYIALAAALGLFFNKEKLGRSQWMGVVIVVAAVIILAVMV